ncbi:hypothetical protein [Paenibacillus pectinilyticus]|uniref:hypothetical protein n=1 Tax=Paenibacillus pectinilyticus TaxID=512399 RepID=UPI0014289E35|nr:hypothetical protein [Paenibacillus pectinilyticus]
MADHVENSEQLAGHVAANLKTISEYQRAMVMRLTGQRVRSRQIVGKPGKPWLRKGL